MQKKKEFSICISSLQSSSSHCEWTFISDGIFANVTNCSFRYASLNRSYATEISFFYLQIACNSYHIEHKTFKSQFYCYDQWPLCACFLREKHRNFHFFFCEKTGIFQWYVFYICCSMTLIWSKWHFRRTWHEIKGIISTIHSFWYFLVSTCSSSRRTWNRFI